MPAGISYPEMERTLKVFLAPGQVTELRAPDKTGYKGSKHTWSGFFDDAQQIKKRADELGSAPMIYIVPNPIHADLLARCANKIHRVDRLARTATKVRFTAQDTDILRRNWLLLSFEPMRRAGISSNDDERTAALEQAKQARQALGELGWSDPLYADSGNGADLVYRIDLPTDDDHLVERVLKAAALKFDTANLKIDQNPSNPAFLLRLYGTVARIGSDVPERPHRRMHIIEAPEMFEPVPVDQLEKFASSIPVNHAVYAEATDNKPLVRLYTVKELRSASFNEPEPLVDGLIARGETVLLVGRPKTGKSLLTEQCAICLSRGVPFLGRSITRKQRVLLLDLENRPAVAQLRFAKMCEPHEDDQNIVIYAPLSLIDNALTLEGEGFTELEQMVRDHKPDVLIIDTWRLLIGPVDENKSEVVLEGLRRLSRLRSLIADITIILVHHLRKQQNGNPVLLRDDPYSWVESVSGHHALVGHVDCIWGLEREQVGRGEELIVFGGVARSTASICIVLEHDPDQSLLFSVASGDQALEAVFSDVEGGIWSSAKRLRHFRFTDLVTAAKTTNKKAVAGMLRKALSQGALFKLSDGSYSIR